MTDSKSRLPLSIPQGLRRVLRYALPYWKVILVVFVTMLLYSVGIMGRAYLLKPFYERVIAPSQLMTPGLSLDPGAIKALKEMGASEEDQQKVRENLGGILRDQFFLLIGLALGIAILLPLVNFVKEYASSYVVGRMVRDLQGDLCDKFLRMPLSYHNRARKGEIYARLNSDVSTTAGSFNLIFGDLIQEPINLAVGVVIMLVLNWQLTCMLLLVVPMLVGLTIGFGKKLRRKSLKRQEKVADQMASMVQMFSGIKVVKAFRMEKEEARQFRGINNDLFRREMKVVKTSVLSKSVSELFNHGSYVLFLGIGVYAIMEGMLGLTFGVLVAFLGLATTMYRPLKNLSKAYNQVSEAMAGIQRVSEVFDLESEIKDGTRTLSKIEYGIQLDKVSFSYDGDHEVLKDIDLEIRKGETVALVGRTGVGKTTLSDLIPRFYDPTRGRVLLDGMDLTEFQMDSLLGHIAVVTQEPFLFDTAIAENIRYGKPEATQEEVEEAARAAYIHDMVASLPEGYGTRVGDRGARLSGGERQRITIARAILRNPAILILDEATSSLDAESEALVQKAINNLMKGRTTVVIAHRLATVRSADKIVVLEGGRITMTGRHEELMRREGLYRELCAMQFEAEREPEAPAAPAASQG
jgi:ATP-binding cassette, subfamily B, bacterial MsbA